MPYPNKKVVEAILESYLNMRAEGWQVTAENIASLDKDSTQATKVAACKALFDKLDNINTRATPDWVGVLKDLQEEVERQNAEQAQTQAMPLGTHFVSLVNKLTLNSLVTDRLLGQAVKAAQSYILSELADRGNFAKTVRDADANKAKFERELKQLHKDRAEKDVITAKQVELDAVKKELSYLVAKDPKFHEKFFKDYIAKQDPKAKALEEKSFADFAKNAEADRRGFVLRDAIKLGPLPAATAKVETSTESESELEVPEPVETRKSPRLSQLSQHSFVNQSHTQRGNTRNDDYKNKHDYEYRRPGRR